MAWLKTVVKRCKLLSLHYLVQIGRGPGAIYPSLSRRCKLLSLHYLVQIGRGPGAIYPSLKKISCANWTWPRHNLPLPKNVALTEWHKNDEIIIDIKSNTA